MRVCAGMPGGKHVYRHLRKRYSHITDDPEKRLPRLFELATWLKSIEKPILGGTFFEVGTGHLPIIPVCLSLMGAEKVITFDLHCGLDFGLMKGLLGRMTNCRKSLVDRFLEFSSREVLDKGFELLQKYKDTPHEYLAHAGIEYCAPADAAHTGLPDASIDCHFSVTVFEHIPPDILLEIMREAKRLLKESGVSIHLIDLTDHFWHFDKSISWFNFYRYSEREWNHIAGNDLSYVNRMRSPDFNRLFLEAGFKILRQETPMGSTRIPADFPLDDHFTHYALSDLSVTHFNVLLGVGEGSQHAGFRGTKATPTSDHGRDGPINGGKT